MKLLFKQRLFSWLDSYDIFNEAGDVVYYVKGQLALGHCLNVYDKNMVQLGTVKQKLFTLLPCFYIYLNDELVGTIKKSFSFFSNDYRIDYKNWKVEGSFTGWNYEISDKNGNDIALISKELFHLTDHYVIDVNDEEDALSALLLVLAIDAEKCSANRY